MPPDRTRFFRSPLRGLFAKFLICMLLVPLVARCSGFLLSMVLNGSPSEMEQVLESTLPIYAQAVGDALDRGGTPAALALIASAGNLDRLSLSLRTPGEAYNCGDLTSNSHGLRMLAIPIPSPRFTEAKCLVATMVLRPRILSVLPASRWALVPLLELATGGIVSFFLARYLVRPIAHIRSAAAAFAAGDLTARAGSGLSRRRDEAADLVREFDRMADRVATSLRTQQRFIGDVSHEIKSPLARLSMALGLARRDAGAALEPRFDRMEYELETVSRLVRELLMLSTLEGNAVLRHSVRLDLAAVVQDAVKGVTLEWRERARAINLILPDDPVWVSGDAALLRRVAENVLTNALFYAPDGTAVDVLLNCVGFRARLTVCDDGPGVPQAALARLFDPFYRVDEARARNTGGAGLGLAICKRAVALHGGHISAENGAAGLIVRIELPVLTVDAGPVEAVV